MNYIKLLTKPLRFFIYYYFILYFFTILPPFPNYKSKIIYKIEEFFLFFIFEMEVSLSLYFDYAERDRFHHILIMQNGEGFQFSSYLIMQIVLVQGKLTNCLD